MGPVTNPELRLEVHRGRAALELAGRPEFREAWRALHRGCPWATAFQDAPFADTWYRTYDRHFSPVIVTGWTDATLVGLFLLAESRDDATLCHVGGQQAEYQVWLATDARFVERALDALAGAFPRRKLQLLFAPPGVTFTPPAHWQSRCFHRPFSAPYVATNPADSVRESMRKKANKSKLNRLARGGKVTFERIRDDAAFAGLLDEFIPLYELRQGAAHDALPFREDPLKRSFYLALKRETDLLHVTAMRVDDVLVAAHIGVRSGNTVLVGMPAQSPRHARHSAGKLLFYELALLLEQEGIAVLDLTPGGEYKDRFATHFDEASVLTIFFSHAAAWRYRLERRLIDAGKRRGVSTDAVKRALRRARHTIRHVRPANVPMQVVRRVKRATWGVRELRLYRFPRGKPVTQPEWFDIPRDRIEDLACYAPVERWQPSAGSFLQTASERLEQGEHCYTYVEDGVLAHFGWLIDHQESTFLNEVNQSVTLPPDAAVLYGFYTDPRFRGRGLYSSSLARMIGDARKVPGLGDVYICVLADNRPSRRVIEKLGFEYERSFYERRQFARVRRWSTVARGGAPARA